MSTYAKQIKSYNLNIENMQNKFNEIKEYFFGNTWKFETSSEKNNYKNKKKTI